MAKMVCHDVGDLPPEPLVIEDGLVNQVTVGSPTVNAISLLLAL